MERSVKVDGARRPLIYARVTFTSSSVRAARRARRRVSLKRTSRKSLSVIPRTIDDRTATNQALAETVSGANSLYLFKVVPEYIYMVETLGQLIQRRLTDLGMRKSELARSLGVSATYVGDLANDTARTTKSGRYTPSPEMARKLARVLEVRLEEVLAAIGYLRPRSATERASDPLEEVRDLFFGWDEATDEERERALDDLRMIAERFQRRRKSGRRKPFRS